MTKTTKKDFELFKGECEKWIKEFGLLGWRFYYAHSHELDDVIAWIEYSVRIEDRIFTIGLEPKFKLDYILIDIKRAAFHEIMHALLHRLQYLALSRVGFKSDIDEEIHNIIRILENVVFDR